jgi:hypothetical protein
MIVTALQKGMAADWNEDHVLDFTLTIDWQDAFMRDVLEAHWDISQIVGAGTVAMVMDAGHNAVQLDSGAAGGDTASMRIGAADITNMTDTPIAIFAVNAVTNGKHEFGFFRNADTPFTANQEGAYFRIVDNVLYAVVGTGAAESAATLGAVPAFAVYWIEFTASSANFYVTDRETNVASHLINLPTNDLTLKISSQERTGVSQTLRCDAVGMTRNRKAA